MAYNKKKKFEVTLPVKREQVLCPMKLLYRAKNK